MFREAFTEIRFHPGRVIATLVAIAISVGFMAAVSVFIDSQGAAVGKMLATQTRASDVVVEINNVKSGSTIAQLEKTLDQTPGVAAETKINTNSTSLKANGSESWTNLFSVPPEDFRWSKLTEGSWPTKYGELAISPNLVKSLKVKVGDTISVSFDSNQKFIVTGITNDPNNLMNPTAYTVLPSDPPSSEPYGIWLIKAQPGTDLTSLVNTLRDQLKPYAESSGSDEFGHSLQPIKVSTAHTYQQDSIDNAVSGLQPMKWMLMVFAVIALLVGMIIISNTFSILLAQRRRQIGLLRAVGASGNQVRGRFLAESMILGVIGSLAGIVLGTGIAAIGLAISGSLGWGIELPAVELGTAVIVGTVITVLAAMGPSLRATRVAPLEALRPVTTVEQRKRVSRVRAIICVLLIVVGIALVVVSLTNSSRSLVAALGAGFVLTIGILGATPLFIPWLLRGVATILGRLGAVPRIAALNAVRNPSRASATATALMLAIGLIVTLQVGTATVRATMTEKINSLYPVDITIEQSYNPNSDDQSTTSTPGLPVDLQQRAEQLPNVVAAVKVHGTRAKITGTHDTINVRGWDAGLEKVVRSANAAPQPGTILFNGSYPFEADKDGQEITLKGPSGEITGKLKLSNVASYGTVVVAQSDLTRLNSDAPVTGVWLKLTDRSQFGAAVGEAQQIVSDSNGVEANGAALMAWIIDQILNVLLLVTTGLLGVAVVIALIGVANTLGLSVIERTQESALLRALGMQRSHLRLMLLVEALILALIGTIVGIAAGSFFGWLGVRSAFVQMSISLDNGIHFGIEWGWTIGMIVVTVIAAALASIGPGRRAAKAAPAEALAAD